MIGQVDMSEGLRLVCEYVLCFMFRAMAVDCSVMLLSYFISSGALESPNVLLSYSVTTLTLHNTNILIITIF